MPAGMMSAREDRRLLKTSIAFIVRLVAIGVVANIRYLDLGEGSQLAGPEIGEIALAPMYSLAVFWVAVFVPYLMQRVPGRTHQTK